MKSNVKCGWIKEWRFKCSVWSNSLMHSWWNVFTGGEFRCEEAVKECYSVSLSLKDCVQRTAPTQTCSAAIVNSQVAHSIIGLSAPKLLTPAWSASGLRCKSVRLKGTNCEGLKYQHCCLPYTHLWIWHSCVFGLRSTVSRERGRERTKLARRLWDSCMSDWMKETGNMKWKTAPWPAMSTAAHQFSEAKNTHSLNLMKTAN